MAFFTWTESMSVGVTEFDNHHKKLIELLNTLFDAMKEGKSKEVIGNVLDELVKYTEYHFQAEESKMKEFGYPGLAGQQAEHMKFVEQITAYDRKYKSGDLLLSVDMLQFMKDWLSNHILKTDMAYKPFFANKGIR